MFINVELHLLPVLSVTYTKYNTVQKYSPPSFLGFYREDVDFTNSMYSILHNQSS